MKNDFVTIGGIQLPTYLGYGILDQKSIKKSGGDLTANYLFEGTKTIVHQVKITPNRCLLESFFNNRLDSSSQYPDLETAVTYDFMSRDLATDPCWQFLAQRTSLLGNIDVISPGQEMRSISIDCFPSGKLLLFRLPLSSNKKDPNEIIQRILKKASKATFVELRDGWLVYFDGWKDLRRIPIRYLDFMVPLAYMTSTSKDFIDSRQVNPNKRFRLMVFEFYAGQSRKSILLKGEDSIVSDGYWFDQSLIENDIFKSRGAST